MLRDLLVHGGIHQHHHHRVHGGTVRQQLLPLLHHFGEVPKLQKQRQHHHFGEVPRLQKHRGGIRAIWIVLK